MKFRPLVRKLPTAPLDQLHPQETPGPPKTEDWGKVKVRRSFPHIKSEQESESEEKLSSHSMRLVILKLKEGKPAQRVLYFSAWTVVGSISQCWCGQMLRVATRPEHFFKPCLFGKMRISLLFGTRPEHIFLYNPCLFSRMCISLK